jgi:DNA polymerase-1
LDLKEYLRDHDPDFPEIVETVKHKNTLESVVFPIRKLKITGKEWEKHDYPYKIEGKWGILKALIILNNETEDLYIPALNKTFYKNHKSFMIEREYVIPENTLSFNWGSPVQKLELFKMINPAIENTNAETVEDNLLTHPIFVQYKEYQETSTLVTKFGMDYLKHIQQDGRIRTVFNTVLATGRISAKEPNLLQLPRNKDYRACFTAPQGYKIVSADYEAEELAFIAILSEEPVWLDALRKGHDLHSINAELLYEDKWQIQTEPECDFVKSKQKCKCIGHKEMRTTSKTLSFGLSYGLSSYGFAARNHITEDEAKRLIKKFFDKYTMIHKFLSKCGRFGISNNFIYESGMGRVRYFDAWKTARKQNWDGSWIYANEKEMKGVMRASMNFPIQSLGASVLKIACVLLRRWIIQNSLQDKVQIALPPHDEILLYVKEDFAEQAAPKLEHYMQLAGKLVLKTDLLRAKSLISDYWKKD